MSGTGPRAAVALTCGDTLGEGATWSVREAALFWVDVRAPALHCLHPTSGVHRTWPLPELCGGVALAPRGVVLALRHELAHLDTETGRLTRLCEVEPAALDNRLNEARCDRMGRLWIGSMRDFGAAVTGSLYRVGPELRPRRVLEGLTIPNGLGWSPDGATMYFADTPERVLRAYAYDQAAGILGSMHPLLPADALPGRPDGCAVDASGHVWTTRPGAGQVVRVAPDGQVTAVLSLPVSHPTCCALGGPGLQTLYVTTARQRLSAEQLRGQPHAGDLFAAVVDVPGLPEPEFAGLPRGLASA